MQASDIIQPTVLSTPVAVDGIKNTIPTNPTSSSSNLASITQGFPSITMQSVANGGLPPMGQDFNGLFYLATDQKVYLQNGGVITFNENVSTAIGGYPNGAILDYVDSNNNFLKVQSLIDNNTYNFVTTPSYIDGTHWQLLNNGGANKDLSNLSDTGNDYINQSKALTTGNVSSNPDIYADILERAHSTFDKSKFEVVGSPTISDNGIANKFDTSSVIKSKGLTFTPQESLIFKCAFTTGNDVNTLQYVLRFYNNLTGYFITNAIYIENGYVKVAGADNASASVLKVEPNSTYYAELIWTKDLGYYVGRCSTNNIDFTEAPITSAKTPMQGNNSVIWIGNAQDTNLKRPFLGSIDLKSVAAGADGVPLFNGNKTDLEIIKPDSYEVVGSPTISDNGIASGFSTSNYIKSSNIISLGENDFSIIVEFTTPASNLTTAPQVILGASLRAMYCNLEYGYPQFAVGTGGSNWPYILKGDQLLNPSTQYKMKLTRNGNSLVGYISENNQPYTQFATANITGQLSIPDFTPYIGIYGVTIGSQFLGTINLNTIIYESNGNVIYQPCLKIPYTWSSNDSKIVDVAYRSNVQILYEQIGEALYYTIDKENQNFTAPMGDIYGMIQNCRSEWVNSYLEITALTQASLQKKTWDLSEYLPKDDYDYEVLINAGLVGGRTTSESSHITLYLTSDIITSNINFGDTYYAANANGIVPISTSRKLYSINLSTGGQYNIAAVGYRRIAR